MAATGSSSTRPRRSRATRSAAAGARARAAAAAGPEPRSAPVGARGGNRPRSDRHVVEFGLDRLAQKGGVQRLDMRGHGPPLLAQPLDRVAKLRLVTMARAGTGLADQGLEPVDFGIRMGH